MNPDERRTILHRVFALSTAAVVLLVPANVLPVMFVEQAGKIPVEPTILGGVRLLFADGMWGLAAIVFTASVVVPLLKVGGIAVLWWTAWRGRTQQAERLTRVHAILEYIGRWSMLDVFLVAFLSGAVRFGSLASVQPRAGIVAFALVVILTMLATRNFDPRLLWPGDPSPRGRSSLTP